MLTGRLGIVGGVGPLAAAHFYQRVIQLSPAARDEDHLPVVLVSEQIPSRIEHLMGEGPSPLPALVRAVRALSQLRVSGIALPSATTHAYRPHMQELTQRPIFDMLTSVAAELTSADLREPVIFGTRASVHLRLFDAGLPAGVRPRYPDAGVQRGVDDVIDAVKQGRSLEPLRSRLAVLAAEALRSGGDCLVLGCTELSVIHIDNAHGRPVIDSADVLARHVLHHYSERVAHG